MAGKETTVLLVEIEKDRIESIETLAIAVRDTYSKTLKEYDRQDYYNQIMSAG